MKVRLLLPLAAVLAIIAVSLQFGVQGATADTASLNVSATNVVFGDIVTVTGTVTNAGGTTITLRVNNGVLTSPTSLSGNAIVGNGTSVLTLTSAAGTSTETITARYQCNSTGATFTLQQLGVGTPQILQKSLACSANGQQQLSCQQYTLNFSPDNSTNAPCASACPYQNSGLLGPAMGPCSFPYPAGSQWLNTCPFPSSNPPSTSYYFGNNPPGQFPTYSYPNNSGICSTPVVMNVTAAAVAGQVSLSLSKPKQSCDQSNVLTVEVRDKSGNFMPDGTVVTAAARLGRVDPGQGTTSAGIAYFVYVAPSSGGGTETLTATSGTVKSSVNIDVVCTIVTGGALPALPPPASVPIAQPPLTQPSAVSPSVSLPEFRPRITPPSTGDGALKEMYLADALAD